MTRRLATLCTAGAIAVLAGCGGSSGITDCLADQGSV